MRFSKRKITILIILGVFIVSCIFVLYYLRTSPSPFAYNFRQYVKGVLADIRLGKDADPEEGLDKVISRTLYVNNEPQDDLIKSLQERNDNKYIIEFEGGVRIFDYSGGFFADFPENTAFDFSFSRKLIVAERNDFKAVLSKEWAWDMETVTDYVNHRFFRFLLDENYQKENKIDILRHDTYENYDILTIRINDWNQELFDQYTYVVMKTPADRVFYRIMFKYDSINSQMEEIIQKVIDSFTAFKAYGEPKNETDFYPVLPVGWSGETKAYYDGLTKAGEMRWGIFGNKNDKNYMDAALPAHEEKLGYKFEGILTYAHVNEEFPLEFIERCHAEGRIAELTYQMTTSNNEELFGYSPILDMVRGNELKIRGFARNVRDFGHPVLFRLDNEPNSDWTSYSGVVNLCDPDLYIYTWRMVYDIFEEEGVNNAIWVFNPNDRDYPPNGWNSYLAYYPGNEYVHVFGVTGYNTGDYYKSYNGENWREFEDIYDNMVNEYGGAFDGFPWIITEFASSSIGGDKPKWVENMFSALYKYPQIKMAFWFDMGDYDPREGHEGVVSRPYWFGDSEEFYAAFRKGLHIDE